MNNHFVKLGITGGIGSGKSFLSSSLRKRGIPVFDSDTEAKKLMLSDDIIVSSLKSLLGDEAYMGGEINKPLLASYIFSSPHNAAKVNAIVHPRVKEAFVAWAESCRISGCMVAAIESAILFESGFNDIVDKVVMVHAPLEVRISRVMDRDNTSREKVLSRINSQMSDEEKKTLSDFVIENDGVNSLDGQIDGLILSLTTAKDI